MKTLKRVFKRKHFALHTLSCMALMVATVAANSRCAYIFHDPAKPDSLKRLRKF